MLHHRAVYWEDFAAVTLDNYTLFDVVAIRRAACRY